MSDEPIRQKSARSVTDDYQFARHCARCGASFLRLAPGKTGERGIWRDWKWYCSVECDEAESYTDLVPDLAKHRADHAEADPHRMRQRADWDPGPRS